MSDPNLQVQIEAAEAYEVLHVPALFKQWTAPVLDAVRVSSGDRVLDVACGTGVLAREARLRTGPAGFVAGIDAGPGMLAVAERLAPGIEWRLGMAEALPYPAESFDAVVSQFGLMFFTDRVKAISEMIRVLVPGGRLAIAVWDLLENSAAYPIEVALLDRLAGARAADALREPFVLGDVDRLATLFESAGAGAVTVTTRHGTARFPSIRSMVEADLRGWLPVMGVVLEETQIEQILQEAETVLAEYVGPDGSITFDSPAHIIAASRP